MCISCFNLLQRALNRLYIVSTSYEVCSKYPKRWQSDFTDEKKAVLISRCLTRTSDNSKYFLRSHWLRVNEFQLYYFLRKCSCNPAQNLLNTCYEIFMKHSTDAASIYFRNIPSWVPINWNIFKSNFSQFRCFNKIGNFSTWNCCALLYKWTVLINCIQIHC